MRSDRVEFHDSPKLVALIKFVNAGFSLVVVAALMEIRLIGGWKGGFPKVIFPLGTFPAQNSKISHDRFYIFSKGNLDSVDFGFTLVVL
jgi:hypothetical protein